MSTIYEGVTINKLTLAQYRDLKKANNVIDSQSYVITDLDDYINGELDEKYWQIREGKIVVCGVNYNFINPSNIDMSSLPLNTILLTEEGQNGNIFNMSLVYEEGLYKFKFQEQNNTYTSIMAQGITLTAMQATETCIGFNSVGYGDYAKIKYIHPALLKIIDSISRINNDKF